MIDSGADISIFPCKSSKNPSKLVLYAANNTPISTFGEKLIVLDLGLRREFKWVFILADVPKPIIGADFLKFFHLLPDLQRKCLVDGNTFLNSPLSSLGCSNIQIKMVTDESKYHEIVKQYPELLSHNLNKIDVQHQVLHQITTNGNPVKARPRRLDPEKLAAAKVEFQYLMEKGIIRPSNSNWSNPLHMVRKSDGSWRPCGDYRALNKITVPDSYPIPYLNDFSMLLSGSTVFSKFDLLKAYYQIPVNQADIPKTAVITPFGLFEFLRMPFGLCNAAQTFQRFMDEVVRGLDFVVVYLDDVLVFSKSEEEHLEHIKQLLERFKKYGIIINAGKCELGVNEIDFLGHTISYKGVSPMKKKVEAVLSYNQPSTIHSLRQFLALINFYRKFLPKGAETQAPLNSLLIGAKKKDMRPVPWTNETREAFIKCKQELADATTLSFPLPNATIGLKVDASSFGMGAVLEQNVNGSWQPLGFFSKKLNDAQKKYSTYDRELLAIYSAIKYFRHLLEGRPFKIFTDHKPLIYAFHQNLDKASPRQCRHLDYIAQFSTDINHIAGKENIVADSLSRIEEISTKGIDYSKLCQQQQQDIEIKELINKDGPYSIKLLNFPLGNYQIYCDVSQGTIRPYIPSTFRKDVFNAVHNLSHGGIRTTRKMISQRFFWPSMNKDVGNMVRSCLPCQRNKIDRHTSSPTMNIPIESSRFSEVHIDIVGPLPQSEGNTYLLTCMDRFTRWPEAFPIPDIRAETICKTFWNGWICRFGCPNALISDRGSQFLSSLMKQLTTSLGIQHRFSTSYHPQSNGLLERFHRTLKAGLRCSENNQWTVSLYPVLLGIRASYKEDLKASVAELVYGQSLKIPGDFFTVPKFEDPSSLVTTLRKSMCDLQPTPTSMHSNNKPFISKNLLTCTHVWIRVDAKTKSLGQKYTGPYEICKRTPKYFQVKINDKLQNVSINRLKAVYTEYDI